MRNSIKLVGDLIVTTDNSGGIGEKAQDIVQVSDQLTAYYAARVTLLEQWAADAKPINILVHNFSGEKSWEKYIQGVRELLAEAGENDFTISGSTETNMELLQSAVSVTMIGKQQIEEVTEGQWFIYGKPLVGEEILQYGEKVASMKKIRQALDEKIVRQIWPVGSKGILHEVRRLMGNEKIQIEETIDLYHSAGPSTAILVKIPFNRVNEAKTLFGDLLQPIKFVND